jgi:hypothetical protein
VVKLVAQGGCYAVPPVVGRCRFAERDRAKPATTSDARRSARERFDMAEAASQNDDRFSGVLTLLEISRNRFIRLS